MSSTVGRDDERSADEAAGSVAASPGPSASGTVELAAEAHVRPAADAAGTPPGGDAPPPADVAEFEIGPGERAPISRAKIAEALGHIRELHERDVRPDEGLRERKKRLTRQLISDTATWMFCERGFDKVRVSEVAAEAGVSEKTVFNYFPTKESLVFDREDDVVEGVRKALTDRGPDESPTQAMVAFIERECTHIDALGSEYQPMFLAFLRMIDETPALQAARQQMAAKLVAVARDALAASVGVDPRDPEPYVAAQALMGLWEVQLTSRERHIREGRPIGDLRDAILDDTHRAARLLDTGLWSFNQVAQGAGARAQLADAAKAANEARKQVFDALRQAKTAWSEIRRAHDDAHEARRAGREP
ncbi:TetR family transcriptional regulator [Patulibacter sp. NPDC049589]|uniref:TetR/AcrR family transcriptional regulator n=1 Tax=Patulibacter sp. NPDC049589 TaxID=3154731 RepID=UPI0034297EC5